MLTTYLYYKDISVIYVERAMYKKDLKNSIITKAVRGLTAYMRYAVIITKIAPAVRLLEHTKNSVQYCNAQSKFLKNKMKVLQCAY